MDTFLTVTIVSAAVLWAVARVVRRRRPGTCDGACSGCPGAARETPGSDSCAPAPGPLGLPSRNDGGL